MEGYLSKLEDPQDAVRTQNKGGGEEKERKAQKKKIQLGQTQPNRRKQNQDVSNAEVVKVLWWPSITVNIIYNLQCKQQGPLWANRRKYKH